MSVNLLDSYNLYYGGSWQKPLSGRYRTDTNAATGGALSEVAVAGAEDVDRAVSAARDAFPDWRTTTNRDRATILEELARRVELHAEELATIESWDTGRPIVETELDIADAADLLRYFAGVVRTSEGSLVQHSDTEMSLVFREPYGVVGAIVPWNFPFLIATWKMAPGLAAGNAMVFKPASLTPLSLLHFAGLSADVVPPGVINVVTGSGNEAGEALVNHPGVSKLTFTGSTEVGRSVAAAAARRTIPVTLELGGKSANIVFADADLDRAVEGAVLAIMFSSGQVCNAGSRLIIDHAIEADFLERLYGVLDSIVIGDPIDRSTRMGPIISEGQFESIRSYIEVGKTEGATLAYGGDRLTGGVYDMGYYLKPTVFTDTRPDMKIVEEEIFGPVLVVQRFATEEQAVALANDSVYGLAGAVWTRDINRAIRVARAVEAGTVWVNEFNLIPAGSPFGGYKQSGFGREVHRAALESYTQVKNVFVGMSEERYDWY